MSSSKYIICFALALMKQCSFCKVPFARLFLQGSFYKALFLFVIMQISLVWMMLATQSSLQQNAIVHLILSGLLFAMFLFQGSFSKVPFSRFLLQGSFCKILVARSLLQGSCVMWFLLKLLLIKCCCLQIFEIQRQYLIRFDMYLDLDFDLQKIKIFIKKTEVRD